MFRFWNQGLPDAEIGGAIIDNDGSSRREVIVIRLSMKLRYERHFLPPLGLLLSRTGERIRGEVLGPGSF